MAYTVSNNNSTYASAMGYGFTYSNATGNVAQRAITVTADAKTKVYGAVDPGLTYQSTTGSLYGADAFSGTLSRTAGETVAGGP